MKFIVHNLTKEKQFVYTLLTRYMNKKERLSTPISFNGDGSVNIDITKTTTEKRRLKYPNYDELVKKVGRQRFQNDVASGAGIVLFFGGVAAEVASILKFGLDNGIHTYSAGDAMMDQVIKISTITGGWFLLEKVASDNRQLKSITAEKKNIASKIPSIKPSSSR